MKEPFPVPDRITKSWLKKLSPDVLTALYHHLVSVDDYMNHGISTRPSNKLAKVRVEMEKRGIL
jgi:hypothetical protein